MRRLLKNNAYYCVRMLTAEISIQQLNDDGEETVNGKLLMQVTPYAFAYMITTPANTLGVYEKFSFSAAGYAEELPQLLERLPWLQKTYNQSKCVYFTHEATLVPGRLYETDKAAHHLQLIYGDAGDTKQLADFVADENAYCVYRLPKNMLRSVVRRFPAAGSWHALSLSVTAANKAAGDWITIHFMQDACCVTLYRSGQLLLGKALRFSHFMEVVYYLLSICNQHQCNPETVQVEAAGRISAGSPLYEEMRKYFRFVNFGSGLYRVAEAEAAYPPHFFHLFELLEKAV
jgi:hypothetical protein